MCIKNPRNFAKIELDEIIESDILRLRTWVFDRDDNDDNDNARVNHGVQPTMAPMSVLRCSCSMKLMMRGSLGLTGG